MKLKIRSLAFWSFLSALWALPAQAEQRCQMEVDKCAMRCDVDGKNCRNDCTTKQVCVEVSPPPQTAQPAGGVKNGGVWGGVTIPINPK